MMISIMPGIDLVCAWKTVQPGQAGLVWGALWPEILNAAPFAF